MYKYFAACVSDESYVLGVLDCERDGLSLDDIKDARELLIERCIDRVRRYAEKGFTNNELVAFAAKAFGGEVSHAEIAVMLNVGRPYVSQLIKGQIRKGKDGSKIRVGGYEKKIEAIAKDPEIREWLAMIKEISNCPDPDVVKAILKEI